MRRIVSIWLPDWPITVWRRARGTAAPPEALPFALIEKGTRGLRLAALNDAARARGLGMDQAHADACAMAPDLIGHPAEPDRAREALERLALWAERYSPAVAVDDARPGHEGLFLDMTGGAHLFGGEKALMADLGRRLKAAGVPARLALADTAGAAWGLARFSGRPAVIARAGRAREAIADLPVAALRLDERALRLLRRFGLTAVGDLYAMPRAGLARRFRNEDGLTVVRRLDQALGETEEALEPVRPPAVYRFGQVFFEPILDAAGVEQRLPDIARDLARTLARDGKGARSLALVGFRVDGRATAIEARLSAPSIRPEHYVRLLRERGLERLDLGFGIDALMLAAPTAEPLVDRQADLSTGQDEAPEGALAGLIDRLSARLGDGAAQTPVLRESWVPERSEQWLAASAEPSEPPARDGGMRERPLLLLDPPEPVTTLAELPDKAPVQFVWRRVTHQVKRSTGPERLSPEWWRDAGLAPDRMPRTRDYYQVEDQDGRRFWLFRDGLYGHEERRPVKDGEDPDETGAAEARAAKEAADELRARAEIEGKKPPKIEPHVPTTGYPIRWWLHGVFA